MFGVVKKQPDQRSEPNQADQLLYKPDKPKRPDELNKRDHWGACSCCRFGLLEGSETPTRTCLKIDLDISAGPTVIDMFGLSDDESTEMIDWQINRISVSSILSRNVYE